ncbi:hypothetical protein [Nonomuraea sp. NPDC049504]|uniref:hypothetical protein n=1 Tax=Nonomuraea sp. NPDC049504 TaxID=3154729 RepID=UPI00341DF147
MQSVRTTDARPDRMPPATGRKFAGKATRKAEEATVRIMLLLVIIIVVGGSLFFTAVGLLQR